MLMSGIEIITDGRRHWSASDNLRIVEETLFDNLTMVRERRSRSVFIGNNSHLRRRHALVASLREPILHTACGELHD